MEGNQIDGHALVVGSPGENLKGVDHDVRSMAAMLRHRRFAVDIRTGERATRDGILSGYDELIAKARPGVASVFYYSGHGFHGLAGAERWAPWQGICPTDLKASTATDFRGITAWELSIKQAQLVERTKNVTVILDCCHAAQMSRDGAVRDAVPRALPHPIRQGFAAHLGALRASYGAAFDAVDPIGNRDAVRLVACGQDESAFEYAVANGEYRGAFTEALLEVLREVDGAQVSWSSIDNAIRTRVHHRFLIQRPDIEGPARRRLFSLEEEEAGDAVTVVATPSGYRLGAGRLLGVTVGDIYGVMPSGSRRYRGDGVIAELRVSETFATFASAVFRGWENGHSALPEGAVAVPVEKTAVRRAVMIDASGPARAAVEAAIIANRTLRLAEPDEPTALATLRLNNGALTIEDRLGSLFPMARFPGALRDTVKNLANLGAAQGVRELEGEHGVFANELEIEWGAVDGGRMQRMSDHGGALALRDKLYVKITSKARRPLYAHIFNIGVRGKITLLTDFAPAGVALTTEQSEFVLGRRHDGALLGIELCWPEGMARETFPRIDEIAVIVTSTRANLRDLETVEHVVGVRRGGSKLQDLLAQLQDGLTRDMRAMEPIDGFLVKRLSYFLHPRRGMLADMPFEVDDNPLRQLAARTPDAWLAWRGDHAVPPTLPVAIEIRIMALVVESSRALSADIRVDALICTRSRSEAACYATWTQKYRHVTDGERLDLDEGLVFHGPVQDFVDLYLWVSRDTEGSCELAQLLARYGPIHGLEDAVGALAIGADAATVPWVAAVGASAVLARMAHELLLRETGRSIGLYRTSFLAHEHFGAGLHPPDGLHRAQDFGFSLRIEQVVPERSGDLTRC